jgi:hypothetical protein
LEVRGLGIVRVEWEGEAELGLAVRLADSGSIERLPERPGSHVLLDIALPEIAIDPYVASAPARVRAGVVEILRRTREIAR